METSIITGYKLLTRNLQSLSDEHGRVQYSYEWQEIPGNGGYIAVTDGLTAYGVGERLFQVEGKEPVEVKDAPQGVICFRWVRLVKELKSVRLGNTYIKCYQRKGNYFGVRESFYPDGQPVERLRYRNGLMHGVAKGFYPDGVLEYRQHFRNDEYHGVWENFYPSGQLKYRDYYCNGEYYGVWESFYPDGSLKYRWHSRNGEFIK